jgi:hypothetical protein
LPRLAERVNVGRRHSDEASYGPIAGPGQAVAVGR